MIIKRKLFNRFDAFNYDSFNYEPFEYDSFNYEPFEYDTVKTGTIKSDHHKNEKSNASSTKRRESYPKENKLNTNSRDLVSQDQNSDKYFKKENLQKPKSKMKGSMNKSRIKKKGFNLTKNQKLGAAVIGSTVLTGAGIYTYKKYKDKKGERRLN